MLDISKDESTGFSDKLVGIKAESFILKISCHWQSWEGKLIWGRKRIPVSLPFINSSGRSASMYEPRERISLQLS